MKSVLYYVLIGCLMLCLASCSTSTMFTVYGEPGTQILTPGRTTLATIDNTGKVIIANPDDDYYAFLLSHKPGTEEFIPFALDYKKQSYSGAQLAGKLGMGLAIAGSSMVIVSAIVLAAAEATEDVEFVDDVAIPLIAAGGAMDLVGVGIGLPADCRSQQTNHEYCYKYTSTQKTNQDLHLTKPQFESYKSEVPIKQNVNSESSSKTNKTLSSSSSAKTLKDNATKIEGTYIGNGTLKQGNEAIETYNNISISIKKKSKDIVLVNVIESDGSKFFTTDGEYNIKKQSNGKYVLTLMGISNATIEIDVDYNLVYIHPRVNIDGEIYELNINAKK